VTEEKPIQIEGRFIWNRYKLGETLFPNIAEPGIKILVHHFEINKASYKAKKF